MALTDARSIISRSRATTGASGIDILKFPLDIDNIPHKFVMNIKRRNSTISMSDYGAAVRADSNIKAAIALPVPADIDETFNVMYSGQDLGMIGEAARSLGSAAAAIQHAANQPNANAMAVSVTDSMRHTWGSVMGDLGRASSTDAIIGGLGTAAAALRGGGVTGGIGDIARLLYPGASVGLGAIVNPFTTAVLKGLTLRENSFTWLLGPNNEAESEALEEIIRTLRYHMLPKKNLITVTYPDEVEYTFTGMTDKYRIPTRPSVITDFSVKRSPIKEAGPAFFAKTGAPVFIELTMKLMEVTPMFRDDLEESGLGPTSSNVVPPAAQTQPPSSSGSSTPLIGGGMGL